MMLRSCPIERPIGRHTGRQQQQHLEEVIDALAQGGVVMHQHSLQRLGAQRARQRGAVMLLQQRRRSRVVCQRCCCQLPAQHVQAPVSSGLLHCDTAPSERRAGCKADGGAQQTEACFGRDCFGIANDACRGRRSIVLKCCNMDVAMYLFEGYNVRRPDMQKKNKYRGDDVAQLSICNNIVAVFEEAPAVADADARDVTGLHYACYCCGCFHDTLLLLSRTRAAP